MCVLTTTVLKAFAKDVVCVEMHGRSNSYENVRIAAGMHVSTFFAVPTFLINAMNLIYVDIAEKSWKCLQSRIAHPVRKVVLNFR